MKAWLKGGLIAIALYFLLTLIIKYLYFIPGLYILNYLIPDFSGTLNFLIGKQYITQYLYYLADIVFFGLLGIVLGYLYENSDFIGKIRTQNIRWKGTLLIFVILLIISFYELDSTAPYTDKESMAMFYIYIYASIIISLLFFLSLNFVEKRMRENNFSYNKLLKRSVLLFVIVAFISPIYLFLLYGGAILYLYHIIFLCFLAVAIFFFLSAIIFKKIYNNIRIQRIIFIVALIIFILNLVSLVISYSTCNSGFDYKCVAKKAIKAQNPDICEKGYDPYYELYFINECYVIYSKSYPDSNVCEKIKGPYEISPSPKERCLNKT